MSGELMS